MSNASSSLATQPSSWRQKLRGQPGSFGSPWRVLSSAIFIFFLSQLIAIFIVGFIHGFSSHAQTIGQDLENSPGLQFVYLLLAEGLAAWLAVQLIKRRKLKLASIGLGRRPKWADLKWAISGFVVFYAAWFLVALLLTLVFPNVDFNQQQDVGFKHLVSGFDWAIAFIGLVLIPPLGEETLVRGYLYSGLRSSLKFVPALLITSLLFGVAHVQAGHGFITIWGAALDTFVLSVVLVTLREKTGALYACILVHSLNNLLAFFVHFHGAVI